MISLSNMRTSQIEELATRLSKGEGREEFLLAVSRFLTALTPDGGADEDLIFVTGKRLSSHHIWDYVPATKLGMALRGVPDKAAALFLERAQDNYRRDVLAATVVPQGKDSHAAKQRAARNVVNGPKSRAYGTLDVQKSPQPPSMKAKHAADSSTTILSVQLPPSPSSEALSRAAINALFGQTVTTVVRHRTAAERAMQRQFEANKKSRKLAVIKDAEDKKPKSPSHPHR